MSVSAEEMREVLDLLSQRTQLLQEWKDIAYRASQAHEALKLAYENLSARYTELFETCIGSEKDPDEDEDDADE